MIQVISSLLATIGTQEVIPGIVMCVMDSAYCSFQQTRYGLLQRSGRLLEGNVLQRVMLSSHGHWESASL